MLNFIRIVLIIWISTLSLADDISIGAIRWDAWSSGNVTKQVEKTLGPENYHHRLPWFAKVINDNEVKIDGSSQLIMDQEIEFASYAGLDYWAFLLYPESSSMSISLKNYLKSSKRDQINFCVILHNIFGVAHKDWPGERDRVLTLLTQPGYQTVLDKRPLIYVFKGRNFPLERFWDFRSKAHAMGLNPYYVYMGWNPASDFKKFQSKGFNAVSSYAKSSKRAKYSGLVKEVKKDWESAARKAIPYVPLVTTGWDKKPRQDHPVSWEKNAPYHHQKIFPSTAKPNEIADHLADAITFVQTNPNICVAKTIIIYAWNEHDEGGWLSPTWQPNSLPNTERIDAIRPILFSK